MYIIIFSSSKSYFIIFQQLCNRFFSRIFGRKIGIGTCFCLSFLFIITVLGKITDKETILMNSSCSCWAWVLLLLAGIFDALGSLKSGGWHVVRFFRVVRMLNHMWPRGAETHPFLLESKKRWETLRWRARRKARLQR